LNSPRSLRSLLLAAGCACLALTGGCATLPQSGPTGGKVERDGAKGLFTIVEVSDATMLPKPPPAPDYVPFPPKFETGLERIAPGDVLSIVFYEVGVRVFSGGAEGGPNTPFDPSAKAQPIGALEVDRAGTIRLPYIGQIRAAGMTPRELAGEIEARLRGKSENAQVVVRVDAANGSGVMVAGEIVRPGRFRLSAGQERLLDVITLSGGARDPVTSVLVRVERGGKTIEAPMDGLTYANLGGMPMEPGDRVELIRERRGYAILGAANRVNRYDLPLRKLAIIDALALAGGPSDALANPAAVFVFRYEKTGIEGIDAVEKPVVYHLNMMRPAAYLLGQQFYLADKDVIYIAGAEANLPSKALQIIGQIFTPIALTRQLTD
jgi:polysaccharide export outer membrane protein